jgi:hypothetical protein
MVEYRQWVSVTFEVAKSKGADTSRPENNAAILSLAAEIWQDRKNELRSMNENSARGIAEQEVVVS